MRLSNYSFHNARLISDGEFDILAQCVVNSQKRVLTFFEDIKYLDVVNENTSISCIICRSEHLELFVNKSIGIIVAEQPRITFFEFHNELSKNKLFTDEQTRIGEKCNISPLSSISDKNVMIGYNVIIEEFVSIKDNVIIGDNCIIRSGCIIGGQGYEFKRNLKESIILRVEHAGRLIIGNNIEIKEMCTVHRALFDWDITSIGDYCKIDAHSHIGHGTKIGKEVMIGSHSNIAGNIIINDNVYLGPGVTISNRIKIGNGAKISIGSVVTKDVQDLTTVTGNFAIEHGLFIKNLKKNLSE